MTVQELMNALNKVEDKSKEVFQHEMCSISEIEECFKAVLLY